MRTPPVHVNHPEFVDLDVLADILEGNIGRRVPLGCRVDTEDSGYVVSTTDTEVTATDLRAALAEYTPPTPTPYVSLEKRVADLEAEVASLRTQMAENHTTT